jgi:hypothetical protein
MKKLVAVLVAVGLSIPAFAQFNLPEYHFASGSWSFVGTRVLQSDAKAPLAKVNIKVPQSGPMVYVFNAKYEGGAEDGHGGFGIHLFADKVYPGASWGSGKSYLLWLNYDEHPMDPKIPKGFSAQVYRSVTNSQMDLVQSVDLNKYSYLITPQNLANPVPIKIWMNGDTGEIRVYDPTDPTYYYYFYIDKKDVPMKGAWIALRTNGLKMSFGM